jgi:hypothetical protein
MILMDLSRRARGSGDVVLVAMLQWRSHDPDRPPETPALGSTSM